MALCVLLCGFVAVFAGGQDKLSWVGGVDRHDKSVFGEPLIPKNVFVSNLSPDIERDSYGDCSGVVSRKKRGETPSVITLDARSLGPLLQIGSVGVVQGNEFIFDTDRTVGPVRDLVGWRLPGILCDNARYRVVSSPLYSGSCDVDICPQLAFGASPSNLIRSEGRAYRQSCNQDGNDECNYFSDSRVILALGPFDRFSDPFNRVFSRIGHAPLGAKVGFFATVWLVAIGLIYFGSGYGLGWLGWRNRRGRRIFLLCSGLGWGLWALPWYVILNLP